MNTRLLGFWHFFWTPSTLGQLSMLLLLLGVLLMPLSGTLAVTLWLMAGAGFFSWCAWLIWLALLGAF